MLHDLVSFHMALAPVSAVMLHDLVSQAWISSLPNLGLAISTLPTANPVALLGSFINVMIHVSSCTVSLFVCPLHKPWSQSKNLGLGVFKAASAIISNYITLVQVNPRYISLFIMPAIMLVFIGALFIKASQKSSLKCNQDKDVDGVGAVRGVDIELLFRTSALPGWILYCLVEADSGMVVSQFLLFLSSSMGQRSMMLASFPSEVSPAFEVIHRASLVVMLLTAHNMAPEALGDDAVLVCLPELVAALVWVTIYLGHRGGSSTVRTVEAVLHKAVSPVIAILSVISAYVGWTWQQLKDEPDGAMKMLSSYWYLLVVCSFSVVLLFLCLFALRQCLGQTKDGAPLSELEGAIKLLRFFSKTLYIAGGLCLVLYPLFFVPLRLKLQGLAKDKWRDFLTATNDVASKIIASLFI